MAFPIPDAMLEFHVQQALEKLLKALIAAHGEVFAYTHDLQLLVDQLAALGETLPDFGIPLVMFTRFGVAARYDVGVALTEAEQRQYREVVAVLRAFVLMRVNSLP